LDKLNDEVKRLEGRINAMRGKVKIQTYTHKINGLHENDFILAAKIDKVK